MEVSHDYNRFRSEVQPALQSKKMEFQLLGYDNVSEQEIWDFLKKKKWRKADGDLKIFEIVQSILALKIGEFMNYVSVEALKTAEFTFDLDNEQERLKLLK